MGRYPTGRCPSCGNLAHMCRCGTMQEHAQLPMRIQREMAGIPPRSYFRNSPPPNGYPPQPNQQYPQPQFAAPPQAPAPQPQRPTLDEVWNSPEIQGRVNQVVEQALANYQPEYPAPVQGVAPEALYQLAQMSVEEVPGEAPKNNAGGRLNVYKQARQEVVDYVKKVIGGLLEVVHEQQGLSAGEQAIAGVPQSPVEGAGQVQDFLHESHPAGVRRPDGVPANSG